MKRIIAATLLLQLFTPSYAETYMQEGVFEITLAQGWTLLTKDETKKQILEALKLKNENKIQINSGAIKDFKHLMLHKPSPNGNGIFVLRMTAGPSELTKREFNNLSQAQTSMLSDSVAKSQNRALLAAGIMLVATETSASSFLGYPSIETKRRYYNKNGFLVTSNMHVFYRDTITLVMSLEYTSKDGDSSHDAIIKDISNFKIIAE